MCWISVAANRSQHAVWASWCEFVHSVCPSEAMEFICNQYTAVCTACIMELPGVHCTLELHAYVCHVRSCDWNPCKWRSFCFGRTCNECIMTGLDRFRWARCAVLTSLSCLSYCLTAPADTGCRGRRAEPHHLRFASPSRSSPVQAPRSALVCRVDM